MQSGISVKCARTRQIGFWLLNCQIDATGDTRFTLVSAVKLDLRFLLLLCDYSRLFLTYRLAGAGRT